MHHLHENHALGGGSGLAAHSECRGEKFDLDHFANAPTTKQPSNLPVPAVLSVPTTPRPSSSSSLSAPLAAAPRFVLAAPLVPVAREAQEARSLAPEDVPHARAPFAKQLKRRRRSFASFERFWALPMVCATAICDCGARAASCTRSPSMAHCTRPLPRRRCTRRVDVQRSLPAASKCCAAGNHTINFVHDGRGVLGIAK